MMVDTKNSVCYSQEYKLEIVKRCLSGEGSKEVERASGIRERYYVGLCTLYPVFICK